MNEKNFGSIHIKLEKLLESSALNKNKLCYRAEMQITQINKFYNNKITRLDTDVLARLCYVFDCRIEDLLEYVPPEE